MVADGRELTAALRELLDSEPERQAQRERGPRVIERYAGASERMALALEGLLRPAPRDVGEREVTGDDPWEADEAR